VWLIPRVQVEVKIRVGFFRVSFLCACLLSEGDEAGLGC
jgi:hypothetical protein